MRLSSALKVLRLTCGITLMMGGLLFILLMIVWPGLVMLILGTGFVVNQPLRCVRLLAVLAALFIFYKLTVKHSYPTAYSLLWFSLPVVLMLYAFFALKIKQLIYQFFKLRFYLKD